MLSETFADILRSIQPIAAGDLSVTIPPPSGILMDKSGPGSPKSTVSGVAAKPPSVAPTPTTGDKRVEDLNLKSRESFMIARALQRTADAKIRVLLGPISSARVYPLEMGQVLYR